MFIKSIERPWTGSMKKQQLGGGCNLLVFGKQHARTTRCKTWVTLVVLVLLLPTTNSQCYTSSATTLNETCKICYNSYAFGNCTYQKDTTSTILNQTKCEASCCSMNYNTQPSLCNNYSYSEADVNTDQNQLATILIIVFFSIPAAICLCIMISSCCRRQNNHTAYRQSSEPPLSSSNINIAEYKLDDEAPLMMDQSITCSICIETSCNIRTHCGHSYHSQCLAAWIHKKEKCPMCVGREFNPIALYCIQCLRSVKLVILVNNMEEADKQDWKQHENSKCQRCKAPLEDEISLQVTVLSEKKSGQPDPGEIKKKLEHE